MLELRVLSPLAKVFPDRAPQPCTPRFSGLRNEVISFQLAFRPFDMRSNDRFAIKVALDFPAADRIHIRRVKCVPVRLPQLRGVDDNYLRDGRPGMYPDVLSEIPPHGLRAIPGNWESVWVDFEPDGAMPAGTYPLTIRFLREDNGEECASARVTLTLIDAMLPAQTLIHTKWLHTDCLASYYGVEVFSERYWEITENFVRCAVRRGINAILTPVHTPPLDTREGTYRPIVQLVDITRREGRYTFGFDKLRRWVDMCLRCGVEYFEIAHLFTQWGARFTPPIVANTENGLERIFGWDTPATGEAYAAFLAEYLPALTAELDRLGLTDKLLFHISDEPNAEHLESYMAAKTLAVQYLQGRKVIDALSDVTFYRSGVVEHPVPANDHIEPFLAEKVPGLWTYYCIGQGTNVSNLFVAMPGERTRVLGAQLFKFDIEGFLQWGFNFYYSQFSDYLINPWLDTDCDGFTPAGDAYQVYPGANGQPVESLRLMLVLEALQDLRAMRLLESLAGRQAVLDLIDEGIEPIRFSSYPHNDAWLLGLRDRVNRAIEAHL